MIKSTHCAFYGARCVPPVQWKHCVFPSFMQISILSNTAYTLSQIRHLIMLSRTICFFFKKRKRKKAEQSICISPTILVSESFHFKSSHTLLIRHTANKAEFTHGDTHTQTQVKQMIQSSLSIFIKIKQKHPPPLVLVSPSCSPQWPSAVSGHHLCAAAPPANHKHTIISISKLQKCTTGTDSLNPHWRSVWAKEETLTFNHDLKAKDKAVHTMCVKSL